MIISYDHAVGKFLRNFIAGVTVFSLVTGLYCALIIVLLQELTLLLP